MAPFTSFALIGAGTIGSFVATELLKENIASVKLLTRDDTKPELEPFKQQGATVVKVDYTNHEDLKKALSGVQVVVSTITHFQVEAQVDIARAAKEAGVQLFVPSEYGGPSLEGFDAPKKVVRDALEEIHLPYTVFMPGYFADIFHTYFDYNYTEGYINVYGTGKIELSLTSRYDVARFMSHVLTTIEPADLAWCKLPFEGDRLAPLDIAARAEKKLGKPIMIKYHDYAETKAKADTDIMAFLAVLVEDGKGLAGTADEVHETITKYFPNWSPQKYDAFITTD
ncbi:Isoflavone reductase p3, partial [Globisporangium splendens]